MPEFCLILSLNIAWNSTQRGDCQETLFLLSVSAAIKCPLRTLHWRWNRKGVWSKRFPLDCSMSIKPLGTIQKPMSVRVSIATPGGHHYKSLLQKASLWQKGLSQHLYQTVSHEKYSFLSFSIHKQWDMYWQYVIKQHMANLL